jgi:hypothetical protein
MATRFQHLAQPPVHEWNTYGSVEVRGTPLYFVPAVRRSTARELQIAEETWLFFLLLLHLSRQQNTEEYIGGTSLGTPNC